MSDTELVAACVARDTAALAELFDRYRDLVERRLPSIDDVGRDDLVQMTFMEIGRTAHTYRGIASVRAWILGIASNVARHALRSTLRRRARQARFLERQTAESPRVEDAVERRRLMARVAVALDNLPSTQQLAFVLCDVEHLPGSEIARILAIPEGTVWRRIHDARKALRAALATS